MGIVLLLLSLMASRSSASLARTHHTISLMREYTTNSNKSSSIILSQIYDIRGGGDEDASSTPYEPSYNYAPQQQQQQQQQHQQPPPQLDGTAGLSPTEPLTSSSSEYTNPSYEYRETVEDRIDAWRKQQQVCSYNIHDSTCSFCLVRLYILLDSSLMLNVAY